MKVLNNEDIEIASNIAQEKGKISVKDIKTRLNVSEEDAWALIMQLSMDDIIDINYRYVEPEYRNW